MDIFIGCWAKDRETFDAILTQFKLTEHPDLRLSGAGYSGWSGVITKQDGTIVDEFGNVMPNMVPLPGVYVNCWVLDPPRELTGRKSLARNLRHLVNADGSETKIDQENIDSTRKTLVDRLRLTYEALKIGGAVSLKIGSSTDTKMPPSRLELKDSEGNLIFTAYSLEPDDINKPSTPACVWA